MSAGTYFGKFFLLKRLAQGGMGEIFVARQQGPGGFSKTVALKKILPHLTDNAEFVQGFLGEASLSAKMTHRNIVQVFDFGLDEETNSYFLTMEYIAGKPLNDIIEALQQRGERMPPALVKDIAIQMCEGMSYAHNLTDDLGQPLNLVHRDLNPSNVLISYNGDVKIIDWGIAKSEMSQVKTEAGMIKGKFVYMSPEQSMAKALDKRSDVFAAGITLYEMLTGENPFHKPNVVLSLEAIQRFHPPLPGQLDPACAGFDAIIARALSKDRDERYSDCLEMAEELKAVALPPAPERVGAFVGRLFRADLEQEQRLMQESGPARTPPRPRSLPAVPATPYQPPPYQPPPYSPSSSDDEKGGTLVMGEQEVDKEQLRREMEAARRRLEAQRAPPEAPEPAARTMFLGAEAQVPPPPRASTKKGLLVGALVGVVIGLVGVVAFFALKKSGPVSPAVAPPPVAVNVVAEPAPAVEEKAPEPEPEPARVVKEAPAPRPRVEVARDTGAREKEEEARRQAAAAEQARLAAEQEAAARQAAEEAEKARLAQVAAATVQGVLLLKPVPALPGRIDGKSVDVSNALRLRNASGKVELGDAGSPMRISVAYRVDGDRLVATVDTDPWSIISVGETTKGKSPQSIVLGEALQKVEFRHPGLDPSPRLMVKFSKE